MGISRQATFRTEEIRKNFWAWVGTDGPEQQRDEIPEWAKYYINTPEGQGLSEQDVIDALAAPFEREASMRISPVRVSASVRLILAMFNLIAGIEEDFGKAVLDMLKKQYPDQKIVENSASLGHKLMAIARKQIKRTRGTDEDAYDAIQDFLTYLVSSKWDFTKDFPNYEDALKAIFSNVRNRAMSHSMGKARKQKHEKSIDEAFGKRDEGGSPEGGEGRIPDVGDDTPISKALDDRAAIKEFMDLVDEHVVDLENSLSPDCRALFNLIFHDEVGTFGSDIKDNMGQATALKEKNPEMFERNKKRWSGFVGDLRKRLIDEIWSYIENEMSNKDYNRLRDHFFSETSPEAVRGLEKKKVQEKTDYQTGIDTRKLGRFKWMEQQGQLKDKDKKSYENLKKKLQTQGVDVDAIEATPPAKPGAPTEEGADEFAELAQAV